MPASNRPALIKIYVCAIIKGVRWYMLDCPLPCDSVQRTCVIFNPALQVCQTVHMPHFPQPHSRVRAPRVRIPGNETVKFNLSSGHICASLHRLSLTGGLVQFHDQVGELTLAEVVLTTDSGPVKALVEFLGKTKDGSSRAFRFIALDDPDFNRLVAVLQTLRKQGLGENTRCPVTLF